MSTRDLSTDHGAVHPPALLAVLPLVLRHRRVVLQIVAMSLVLAVAYRYLSPRRYQATAAFISQSKDRTLPVGLGGLAAQLGVAGGSTESPRFYSEVVKSRPNLEVVANSRFRDPRGGRDSVRLLDLLIPSGDSAARIDAVLKHLQKRVATRVDVQTNIVRVSYESPYPALAAAVTNRLVGQLNEFNAHYRQSHARQRRLFIEARVSEAEARLRDAEDELKAFHVRNRSFSESPGLTVEQGRLRRRVDEQSEVYLTLRREYETARIEEVNDTPVITVIEPAVPPRTTIGLGLAQIVALGLLLGGMAGILVAIAIESRERLRVAGFFPS